jgi:hypothetical protein
MENRSEHIPPEQGWGAYATPPSYPSHSVYRSADSPTADAMSGSENTLPAQNSWCFHVREKLQPLLENDEEIRPELATALYGHLATCTGCSQEFEQIQKIVALLEAIPPLEIPTDYSRLIMRRIQAGDRVMDDAVNAFPTFATSSATSGEVAVGGKTETTISKRALTEQRGITPTHSVTHQQTTSQTILQTGVQTGIRLWQRMMMAVILSTMALFCLTTSWGRQMLGANVETSRVWLGQLGDMLSRVPLLGWLASFVFAALSDMGEILETTFRELGSLATRGLAIDVALFAAACFFLAARRQRSQLSEI